MFTVEDRNNLMRFKNNLCSLRFQKPMYVHNFGRQGKGTEFGGRGGSQGLGYRCVRF